MAKSKSTQSATADALPSREVIEQRVDHIDTLIYQAKSVASAAEEALCKNGEGVGSDVHGCLQVAQRLLEEAQEALDSVVLFAPVEAQEVANA